MAPLVDEDGWITSVNENDVQPIHNSDNAIEYPPDDASTSISSACSTSESSSQQAKPRKRTAAARHQSIGIDPALLVGKVLKHIRRSPNHPAVTLTFSDNTAYQLLVDGYDPRHKGVPKVLEMDDYLQRLFDPPEGHIAVDLLIRECTFVNLSDKAYERREWEHRWDQSHLAIAFKFGEEKRWHCVWATLAEYDEEMGHCIFRSYDDVYLQPLVRNASQSPQKARNRKREAWR